MPSEKTPSAIAFGRAVREVRIERKFAQETFAAHAGIDRSYYGSIERGEVNVSFQTMLKLSAALDTPVSQLLRRAGL